MPTRALIIRDTQLFALGKDVDRRWTDGIVDRFARSYPTHGNVRVQTLAAIDRARKYGITAKEDVEWFVRLDFQRGHEWEKAAEMDWAMDILDNPGVDVAGRRYRIEKWLRKWDEA